MTNLVALLALIATCYFALTTPFSLTFLPTYVVILVLIRLLVELGKVATLLYGIIEILNEEEEPEIYHPPYEIEG